MTDNLKTKLDLSLNDFESSDNSKQKSITSTFIKRNINGNMMKGNLWK